MGDPNPLWSDPEYAKNTRWGGIIAPPTFEVCIKYKPSLPDANIEGGGLNIFDQGGQTEYFGVARPGDEFTCYDTYPRIIEKTKAGSPYRLLLQIGAVTYINQRGEKYCTKEGGMIIICTPPGEVDAVKEKAFGGERIKRPRYTKEQLDELYRHYDDELSGKLRRGAETRYWEDVTEGEEIPTIMKGPLDDFDVCAYMGSWGVGQAFAVKWAAIRRDSKHCPVDPETGALRAIIDWHFSDTIAQEAGVPYAMATGGQNMAIIAHALSNWMGDDAFVKKLGFQVRFASYFGDMNWIKGKVVRKYIEESEHLIDLSLWAETQRGDKHTVCTATVKLVSREAGPKVF
jgi:acyl dehydratase